jgi:hypothetical protein
MNPNEEKPTEETVSQETATAPESVSAQQPIGAWKWIRFGLVAFALMLFYIYNQHHANKGLRNKEKLTKELKELNSEKISLESELTNASKQSELARRLKETGLKELTVPPVKLEKRVEKPE